MDGGTVETPQTSIIIKYDFHQPIDLLHLTTSLAALGEEFRRDVADRTDIGHVPHPRLHVAHLSDGSIIAELIVFAAQVDWILDHRALVADFVVNWWQNLSCIRQQTEAAFNLSRQTIQKAQDFVAPIEQGNAQTINITVNNGGTVIFNNTLHQPDAHAIHENARNLLNGLGTVAALDYETSEFFEGATLELYQIRDATGATGDRGIIERYGRAHRKLTWETDGVKQEILADPHNPFSVVFIIAGYCRIKDGAPVAYHIVRLDDVRARGSPMLPAN